MVDDFIQLISNRNQFQKKLLKDWKITEAERQDFENILNFYTVEQGYTLEFLADAYSFINQMVVEESYFSKEIGDIVIRHLMK